MAEPTDPLDAGLRVAAAFDAAQISYALGGALAYALWAIPRATIDVDINLFVGDHRLPDVGDALRSLGISADDEAARRASEREGLYVTRYGPFRLDLFTPSIDFAWEAERTRVAKTVAGQRVWFLSPEALAVFKLLFFRGKDIADLERLVAVQDEQLDRDYVRRHIVAMMGDDDERVARWDAICQAS